jgi:hypothetical protein
LSKDKKIKVALGTSLDSKTYRVINFSQFVISSAENPDCLDPSADDIISMPHSNSFLDLDGDCMPDIFMSKMRLSKEGYHPYYEIYT